jgi:hypothetical protein
MALTPSKVKTPLGMRTLDFWPIASEPDKAHPVYGASINLGAAVKGYLTVTTGTATIAGDDINQVDDEFFVSAQLDTETTMSDLQINAQLFGHTWSEEAGEESKSTDRAIDGGLSFIEPILRKDKSIIYRVTCLRKATPLASSEKQEADTRKPGELNPKMNAVSFKIAEDNLHSWRIRKDFETEDAAAAFIKKTFGAAT